MSGHVPVFWANLLGSFRSVHPGAPDVQAVPAFARPSFGCHTPARCVAAVPGPSASVYVVLSQQVRQPPAQLRAWVNAHKRHVEFYYAALGRDFQYNGGAPAVFEQ